MATYAECGEIAGEIYIKGAREGGRPHSFATLRIALASEGFTVSVKTLSQWSKEAWWQKQRDEHAEAKRFIRPINDRIVNLEEELLADILPIREKLKGKINNTAALYPDNESLKLLKEIDKQILEILKAIRQKQPAGGVDSKSKNKKRVQVSQETFQDIQDLYGVTG